MAPVILQKHPGQMVFLSKSLGTNSVGELVGQTTRLRECLGNVSYDGLCGSHFEIYSRSTEKELPVDHCQFAGLPFGLEVKPVHVKPPLTWDWLGSHNDFLLGPPNLCSSLTMRTFSQLNGQHISVPALDTPVSWI